MWANREGGEGGVVNCQDVPNVRAEPEHVFAPPPSGPAEPNSEVRVRDQPAEGDGESIGRLRRDEQAGLLVENHFRNAADVPADDGDAQAIASSVALPSGSTWDGTSATSAAVSQSGTSLRNPTNRAADLVSAASFSISTR